MDASPCNCDQGIGLTSSTGYFNQVSTIQDAFEGARCPMRTAMFFHPDTYPIFNEYFWMKSKLMIWWGGPDLVSSHYLLWDRHPELLQEYNDSGYCTGTYG
mmetsp:Transcript_32251/g.23805  ORF Transcript_32251/g.23805 Transcript_32251/m.23805 type:complete len:101 (+) Transcript_32251:563-865(+)